MKMAKHKMKVDIVEPFRIDGPECLGQLKCVRWTSSWTSGRRFTEGMNRLARMIGGRLNYPYIYAMSGAQFIEVGDVLVSNKNGLIKIWHEQDFFKNFEEVVTDVD